MGKNNTTIYLVRHGESDLNKQGLISGHVDPELTELGREQAKLARLKLNKVRFDDVYSSDLKRALHTAKILYGQSVPESHVRHELRERHFGSLEGKPELLLAEGNAKKMIMPHQESWTFKHVQDMESDAEVSSRFLAALKEVAATNKGKTILVVAHGGAIRTTIMKLANYTNKELPTGSFKNGGFAELRYDDKKGFKVIQINGVKLAG